MLRSIHKVAINSISSSSLSLRKSPYHIPFRYISNELINLNKVRAKKIETWTTQELSDTLKEFNADKELLDTLEIQRVSGSTLYQLHPSTLYNLLSSSLSNKNGASAIPSTDLDSALRETLLLSARYSMH